MKQQTDQKLILLRMPAHSVQMEDTTTRQVMAPASSDCIDSGTDL